MSRSRWILRPLLAVAGTAIVACSSPEEPPGPTPAPSGGEPAVTVLSPRTGSPGETVRLEGHGFPAGMSLDIGFGPPASEYEVLGSAESGADGRVSTTFEVPAWAEPDQPYLVVLADGYFGPRAISDVFHVIGMDGSLTVTGRITEGGIECPSVETVTGSRYTLLGGDARDVPPGTDVRVSGTVAEASFCMQGISIDVESIDRLE